MTHDNAGLLPCGCGGQAIRNVVEPHQHEIATYMPDYQGGTFIECSKCSMCASSEAEWNFAFTPPLTQARTPASPSVDAMQKVRDAIDAERGTLMGDGYNYTSGEEYGMRRALRIIDKAMGRI